MLLTSVVLILQETLEASLLVAILAAATLQTGRRVIWLPWGFLAGCAVGAVYATNLQRVSEWFDYVGQELTNAALQLSIAVVLVPLACLIVRAHALGGTGAATTERKAAPVSKSYDALFSMLCALTITLSITREGSEIIVYLSGFLGQDDKVQAVMVGSGIGFGIGVSVSLLTFYGLYGLGRNRGSWIPVALLALFSGNMLSQAALQLIQADWLQSGPALWDTSGLLPEQSIPGHLLYALLGYESSPALVQVIAYAAGFAFVLAAALDGGLGRLPNQARSSMKRIVRLLLPMLALGLPGKTLMADGIIIDKIYHPYVQPMEREFEWRAILQDHQPGRPEHWQLYRMAYGMSLGEKWFAEIYVVGSNSDENDFEAEGYEFEAQRQLTEQGEYWADLGVVFELEKEENPQATEFSTGLLAEKEWGKWSGAANLFLMYEWGSHIDDEIETRLGLQARYRYSPGFEPAFEIYAGEDTRGIGPAVLGQLPLGGKRQVRWEAGAIFGIDHKSPDNTLRFLLEFEF